MELLVGTDILLDPSVLGLGVELDAGVVVFELVASGSTGSDTGDEHAAKENATAVTIGSRYFFIVRVLSGVGFAKFSKLRWSLPVHGPSAPGVVRIGTLLIGTRCGRLGDVRRICPRVVLGGRSVLAGHRSVRGRVRGLVHIGFGRRPCRCGR